MNKKIIDDIVKYVEKTTGKLCVLNEVSQSWGINGIAETEICITISHHHNIYAKENIEKMAQILVDKYPVIKIPFSYAYVLLNNFSYDQVDNFLFGNRCLEWGTILRFNKRGDSWDTIGKFIYEKF